MILVKHSLPEIDPFPLWQTLGLPSYAVVSLPDCVLLTVVAGVS